MLESGIPTTSICLKCWTQCDNYYEDDLVTCPSTERTKVITSTYTDTEVPGSILETSGINIDKWKLDIYTPDLSY